MAETHVFSSVYVNTDPRMKFLEDGTAVASFLGGNRPYYHKKGAPYPSYEFEIWGDAAERLNEKVKKGDVLNITSTSPIKCRGWEDSNGETQTRMTVRMDGFNWQWAGGARTSAPPAQVEEDTLPF